jgi:ribonuclease BN (tRNA processing enzyme)
MILGEDPVTVVLSHYHLDHTVGLTYLSGLFHGEKRPVRFAGPRAGFVEYGPAEALSRLTAPPLSSRHFNQFPFPVEIVEFGPGGFELDGIPVFASGQSHPGGSATIRIADIICYATDIAASGNDLPLAAGVRFLLHESWSCESQAPVGVHSGFVEALGRAEKNRVGSLVPVHFGPDLSEEDIQRLAEAAKPPVHVVIPREGYSLDCRQ